MAESREMLSVRQGQCVLAIQEDVALTEQIGKDQDGNGDKCEVVDVEPFNENTTQDEYYYDNLRAYKFSIVTYTC
jgi:hypothetical protein